MNKKEQLILEIIASKIDNLHAIVSIYEDDETTQQFYKGEISALRTVEYMLKDKDFLQKMKENYLEALKK